MSEEARVLSVDVLAQFRTCLVRFQEECAGGLDALRLAAIRSEGWIEHDCPAYWREQLRQSYDRVQTAREELEACKRKEVAGMRPSCFLEQKALQRAKERVEYCQLQQERVRRWAGVLRREADEFRGRLAQGGYVIEHLLPELLGLLERMIRSLEEYLGRGQPEEA